MSAMLATLVAALVAACANDNVREVPAATGGAPPVSLNLSGRCDNIDGLYEDTGTALRAQVVQNPQLAHSLFRLALPGKDGYPRRPESVRLSVDPVEMKLLVTAVGDGAIREWSTQYECRDGWIHVIDAQGERYLGDRVTQKWFRADILLAADVDGNLVAHVTGEGEDKIFMGGKRRSHGEDWYLFRRKN